MTESTVTLFVGHEPAFQPFQHVGWHYHQPISRTDRTWWYMDGSRKHYATREAARILMVDESDLRRWENATDLASEAEGRDEHGDW